MTREEYIKDLFETYSLVSVLSDKNGCRTIRIRNKSLENDMVLHSFQNHISAYEKLCGIKHNNLPLIYDAIDLDDGQIVLEEFINGITAAEVMQTNRYSYNGAKHVLKQVCSALDIVHGLDIVHRDLKPENIIIDKNGRVVLIDFSAAVSVHDKNPDVIGTVGYASPEQLGVSPLDKRTDIYAAGVLLNVMMTGKHPSEELAHGKAGRTVKKCTSINPDDRYQTARKLFEAL